MNLRSTCGVILAAALLLGGCSTIGRWFTKAPAATVKTPSIAVQQSGDVAVPAAATVTSTKQELPIPPGSTVEIKVTPPAKVEATAKPVVLTSTTTTETVKGVQSFTPPNPPTATELAKASGVKWFYIAGVVSGILALLFLWQAHPINAVICGGGAVALPMIGNLVGSEAALRTALVVGAASVALFCAWLLLRKYHPEYKAAVEKKLSSLSTTSTQPKS